MALFKRLDFKKSLLIEGNRVADEKVLSVRLGEPTTVGDGAAGRCREDCWAT